MQKNKSKGVVINTLRTFDERKGVTRHEIMKIEDIFRYTDAMIESIKRYENPAKKPGDDPDTP